MTLRPKTASMVAGCSDDLPFSQVGQKNLAPLFREPLQPGRKIENLHGSQVAERE